MLILYYKYGRIVATSLSTEAGLDNDRDHNDHDSDKMAMMGSCRCQAVSCHVSLKTATAVEFEVN